MATWTEYLVKRRNGEGLGTYMTQWEAQEKIDNVLRYERPPYEREPIMRQRTIQASDWEPVSRG